MKEAWDIEVGQEYVKVRVYDDPINWRHLDFGDGTYIGSKIKGGWNYQNDVLNTEDEIIDWWPVLAGTYKGVSSSTNITGEPFIDIIPSVNIGGTTSSVNVVTYAWWIKETGTDVGLGDVVNKWISGQAQDNDPNYLKYMYSIHVRNNSLAGLDNEQHKGDILLYPNPTDDILNVHFSSSLAQPEIEIYNLEGRLVYRQKNIQSNQQDISIEISQFSKGVYLFTLKDRNNMITKKFIKQ